ncbi:hypothetical protein ABEB36_002038 [Hypothenemus hampei]|uniref:Sorting nexin 13 n=1 Tax=Hypothenemus hampei TaxID=57062 RepID=A0ABD1F4C7_HYPHA
MNTQFSGWLVLIGILLLSTFGILSILTLISSLILFFIGLFSSVLYLKLSDLEKYHTKRLNDNPLSTNQEQFQGSGLDSIRKLLVSPKRVTKSDNRVTGSELIDSSLQEILGYIIRDYVQPWYNLISTNPEFGQVTVKKTAQTLAINISNCVKDIDWIPYLTQRLVDDAATHLRLYKQAREKVKQDQKRRTTKSSPSRREGMKITTSKNENIHKRNKSETDVSWYSNKNTEFGIVSDREKSVGNSKFYSQDTKNYSLEDHFFELECQVEKNELCREGTCTNTTNEKEFLLEMMEVMLYVLLPDEDFQCKPLRFVLRDIFCNAVILPLFDLITDPDYINQVMISICLRNTSISSDIFLSTLRMSDSQEELRATKDLVAGEIHNLRSRDSGGEDLIIKQHLSSLAYVDNLINTKLEKINGSKPQESLSIEKIRKIELSLDQILKDNLGLSYFMDFVASQDRQLDLFFYLSIEGWKHSVGKELSELDLSKTSSEVVYDSIRSTAHHIFDVYLSGKKDERLCKINEDLVQNLHFKIRNLNETPNEHWFDKVQEALFKKMDQECLIPFHNSNTYIKLLHELDLLPSVTIGEDSDSLEKELPDEKQLKNSEQKGKHKRSFSDVSIFTNSNDSVGSRIYDFLLIKQEQEEQQQDQQAKEINEENWRESRKIQQDYEMNVHIIETGVVCEKGKTFGIYAIRVRKQYGTNCLEQWHIYRRYSDFYDLHVKIKEKYPDLSKLTFPGKKTFHNMERAVLERRMKLLNYYLGELCQRHVLQTHEGLGQLLMTFLEQEDYDRARAGPISTTINTLVNPIKKSIKNMPEHLINTMDEVVGGLSKVFNGGKSEKIAETACKVGASIEENDENLAFRIMLLLMDELFDLKSRNQWLRRRIVTILRQIVRTIFGDIVNRKIVDYVSCITSPKNVAHYLHMFKYVLRTTT